VKNQGAIQDTTAIAFVYNELWIANRQVSLFWLWKSSWVCQVCIAQICDEKFVKITDTNIWDRECHPVTISLCSHFDFHRTFSPDKSSSNWSIMVRFYSTQDGWHLSNAISLSLFGCRSLTMKRFKIISIVQCYSCSSLAASHGTVNVLCISKRRAFEYDSPVMIEKSVQVFENRHFQGKIEIQSQQLRCDFRTCNMYKRFWETQTWACPTIQTQVFETVSVISSTAFRTQCFE
jgi:hypothetical protein